MAETNREFNVYFVSFQFGAKVFFNTKVNVCMIMCGMFVILLTNIMFIDDMLVIQGKDNGNNKIDNAILVAKVGPFSPGIAP